MTKTLQPSQDIEEWKFLINVLSESFIFEFQRYSKKIPRVHIR